MLRRHFNGSSIIVSSIEHETLLRRVVGSSLNLSIYPALEYGVALL